MNSGRGIGTGTGSETGTGVPEILPRIPTPREQGNGGMASAEADAVVIATRQGMLVDWAWQAEGEHAWGRIHGLVGQGSRATADSIPASAYAPYCIYSRDEKRRARLTTRGEQRTGVLLVGSHSGQQPCCTLLEFAPPFGSLDNLAGAKKQRMRCAKTETARGLGEPLHTQRSWPQGLVGV